MTFLSNTFNKVKVPWVASQVLNKVLSSLTCPLQISSNYLDVWMKLMYKFNNTQNYKIFSCHVLSLISLCPCQNYPRKDPAPRERLQQLRSHKKANSTHDFTNICLYLISSTNEELIETSSLSLWISTVQMWIFLR